MEELSINANGSLMATHFFVYNGKRYPFNLKLFKCFSQYFQTNKHLFKNITDINLCDNYKDKINLTEGSIKDFIDFCQSKNITLNKENAISLHKLAQIYIVPSLIDATNKFISVHQKEVAIELLIFHLNEENFDTTDYEEIISADMSSYINDDRLLSLPISVLHRIVTKYQLKNHDNQNSPQITDFLFKCLDHFGRKASVLFEQIDLCRSKNIIQKLHNEYSEKFDFHFINSQQLKTVYQLESQILERTGIFAHEQSLKQEEIENLIQKQEEENKLKNNQIQQEQTEMKQMIQQIQLDFKNQLDSFNDIIKQLSEKVEQLNNTIDELKRPSPSVSLRFTDESVPEGIISFLGDLVTISVSKNDDQDYPFSNIKKYDDSHFINVNHGNPNSESDTYIKFDFGPSKRIDLYSYLIRSNEDGPSSSYHPKTWRIEGSNDDSKWVKLDRRVNDDHLNGSYKQYNFECQQNSHENENNRFRFIRYVQEASWTGKYPYIVYITYFELYGDVFTI